MSGFIRRYTSFPSLDVIKQIEGVIIVDLAPPGQIGGIGTGVAGLVAEFTDMTYATAVDASGVVTTLCRPVEVFSPQDMIEKVGGIDETLGEFGGDMGNGYVEIRGKKFARLVLLPVNLCATRGVRVWRDLPTNKSATDPTPIVPLAAATVAAGREFKSGANRVRLGRRAMFTDDVERCRGVDGSVTTAGSAALFQTFNAAGGNFIINGVVKGDILVVGVIGGAAGLGANAATYRVISRTATTLVVEKMAGTSYDWTTAASLPWRVHPGVTADTGPENSFTEAAGYLVQARPLDATIASATLLTPSSVPSAGTATSWDSLSGLSARTDPTTGLTFVANVHTPNQASTAELEALYSTAVDALLEDADPSREVSILWAARTSAAIRAKVRAHCLAASELGVGRVACISPELDQVTFATVTGDASPGVGSVRHERVNYNWPGVQTYIPELVGFAVKGADQKTYTNGMIDVPFAGYNVSALSCLAPERNPGQAADPVPRIFATILGLQRNAPKLGIAEYTELRRRGIAAPRFEREVGSFIIQSGITTSLTSGQKNQNRRRFADYVEDSLARGLLKFGKLPLTDNLKDGALAEVDAFCDQLLSPNNKASQRIRGYVVDGKSGNTPQLEENGVYVIVTKVRMIPTGDFLVIQAEVGEGVDTTTGVRVVAQ